MSNAYSNTGYGQIAEDPRDSLPDYDEQAAKNFTDCLDGVGSPEAIQDEQEWFEDFLFNADGEFKAEIVSFFKEMANQQFAGKRGTDPRFIATRYAFDAYKAKRIAARTEQLEKVA